MKSQLSEHTVTYSRICTRQRRAFATAGAIASLIALSGCTGGQEKREYTVPHSACGTSINAKNLSPFLPSGKELTVKVTSNSQGISKCAISVDGKLIVQTSQEWWNDISVLEFARGMTLDDPGHQTDGGKYVYSDYQAFAKVASCRNSKHKDQVLFVAIQASGSKYRDITAMEQLITDYTKAVEGSKKCA